MWKLTIEDDQGNRIPVPLVRDDYSIGRAVENTLRLTERNVSRRHASLRQHEGGRWWIVDLGSYNGSYVNGERVVEGHELSDGDLIQLGDYRIEVHEDAQTAIVAEEPPTEAFVPAPETSSPQGAPPVLASEEVEEPRIVPVASVAIPRGGEESEDDVAFLPGQADSSRRRTGLLVGIAAVLLMGGAAFAFLRSDPAPTTASEPKLATAPEAPLAAAPPQAKEEPAEVIDELEVAEVEQQAEALAVDLDEPTPEPVQEIELAKVTQEPKPAPEPKVAPEKVAAAAPARPAATAAQPRPPKPAPERRPVLAANPFDPPSEPKAPSKPAPSSGQSLASLAAEGREGEAKMRPILEQRVARGTASESDIKLLRVICRNMGDTACANRMSALLAKK